MATRRRGAANLDDLKARLGYADSAEDGGDASEAPTDAPSEDGSDADAESDGSDATSGASAATEAPKAASAPKAARGASARDDDGEDYSNAVSNLETQTTFEFDANAVDPTIKAPTSRNLVATMIAAAAALVVGVAIGAIFVANNTVRSLENATIFEAQRVLDSVRPGAARLTALDADLASIDAEAGFRPVFQERLAAAYADGRPGLDPSQLTAVKTLLIRDEGLSRSLVNYATATAQLGGLVDRHRAATERDAEEIARLEAGISERLNYGVAIEFETLLSRFRGFIENPTQNPFQPIAAERVTYDNLEMIVEGTGDARKEYYEVTNAGGDRMRVLIHDLVLLPTDQLLPPVSRENALDRYRVRAAQIKESLAAVTAMQSGLLTQLEAIASKPPYFTF